MAYYELVNLSSGNRLGEFDTEDEALYDVQVVQQRRGAAALAAIALVHTDDNGHVVIVAEGGLLAQLADRAPAAA